ncbi:MAG: hypothetical protein COA63_010020 [Methylophaga sp.]|nr:hypothetical protein [Methylophaga sp.]
MNNIDNSFYDRAFSQNRGLISEEEQQWKSCVILEIFYRGSICWTRRFQIKTCRNEVTEGSMTDE